MRPHILFSGGLHEAPRGAFFTSTPCTYAEAIWASGGLPVLAFAVGVEALAGDYDGLLLTGGVDLAPSLFGEEPLDGTVQVDVRRDEYEHALVDAFARRGKPILGICRGIQAINVFFGGDLWQDLPGQCGLDHSDAVHPIHVREGSFLSDIFPADLVVNSFHHQAVRRVAPGFDAVARSADGVVEAIQRGVIWAVQWHPERMTGARLTANLPDQKTLFSSFVALCRDHGTQRDKAFVAEDIWS